MIKYEMNKGELEQLEIVGTVSEIAADMACLYQMIAKKMLDESVGCYSAFRSTLMDAFDAADKMAISEHLGLDKLSGKELVQALVKALFGEDMENFSKEAKAKAYADAEGFNDKPKKKGDKK